MAEKRIEVRGRPVFRSSQGKNNDEREKRKSGRLAQPGTGLNTPAVKPRQQGGDDQPQYHVRQVHRVSAQAVQLIRIQRREQITANPSGGQSLKGAREEVAKEHHPAGGETYRGRKEPCDVGCLARGVGNLFY